MSQEQVLSEVVHFDHLENLMSEASSVELLESLAKELSLDCLQLAAQFFDQDFPVPEIRFDLRGRSAGQYRHARSRLERAVLRFNRTLLVQNPKPFLAEVIAHEVAHLVAYHRYGMRIKPHGREWKAVMSEVYGLKPSVTHSFEVPESGRLKHLYYCDCEGRVHRLSSVRHNRITANKSQYLCRDCRATLRQT